MSNPVEFVDSTGAGQGRFPMRIVYNILIGIMLLGIVAAGAWRAQTERAWSARIDETRNELQRVQREISLRATLRDVPMSERGWPLTIEPEWFDHLPRNALLEGARPWMEIAGASQEELRHPPDPIATDDHQPMFWYNPHNGRLRARVPQRATHTASMELYNTVNGATLLVE